MQVDLCTPLCALVEAASILTEASSALNQDSHKVKGVCAWRFD